MTDTGLELIERLSYENTKLRMALSQVVTLVERDVIRVRPSDKHQLIDALADWNLALSTTFQSPNEGEAK